MGGETLFLYHRNHSDDKVAAKPEYKADPDDLVFLKSEHPMSLKDEKDLKGRTLWVSAGGQMGLLSRERQGPSTMGIRWACC